jgi:hypothetical protein
VSVLADDGLGMAVEELVDNAVVYNDDPTVEVTVERFGSGTTARGYPNTSVPSPGSTTGRGWGCGWRSGSSGPTAWNWTSR